MRLIVFLITSLMFNSNMPDSEHNNMFSPAEGEQKPIFSFGIIADVQYCDCEPSGTRYFRSSLNKLEEAVSSIKSDSVKFVVNLGDLIEKDFDSFKPVMNIINSSGVKFYHLTGNHDYAVEPRLMKRIPQLSSDRDGYYSFLYDRFRFICLNGNEISTYGPDSRKTAAQALSMIEKLKAAGEPNGEEYNGGLSSSQIEWLNSQLAEAKSKNEMAFLLCHFPAWPENIHNLLNYRDVLDILKKYDNIIAWLNGHNHSGNYGNFNMIHFVTLKGMVETETFNSYSVVEVYHNKIWIKGAGREKSQILAY
jgi:3',5'-cyclic AMP phosphodiesterase CpdA